MSTHPDPWPAGTPCWVTLGSADFARTHRFYSGVLGWTFGEPQEDFGGYHNVFADGQLVAGLAWAQPGLPQEWLVYLASDDIDATLASVRDHGGQVLSGPDRIGPVGASAECTDPTGARFGVWQSGTHTGIGLVNEPGAPLWMDLITSDIAAAKDFYAAVFGYTTSDAGSEGMPYVLFSVPGGARPAGGIGQFGDGGSRWTVCFQAADVDAAVAGLPGLGGALADEPHDIAWGRLAGATGPDGEKFYLLTPPPA